MSSSDINDRVQELLDSAVGHFMIQDYPETLNELKSALMLDKENPVLQYNIGICYCKMGLFNSAIQYLRSSINLPLSFIDSNTVKKVLSFCLIKINDYTAAEEMLHDLRSAGTEDNQVLSMLGFLYEKSGRYDEAIGLYREILKIIPDYYGAYNAIAYSIALSGGDLQEAFDLVKKAIQGGGKNPAFIDTAGYVLLKMGDLKRAEQFLSEANKMLPLNKEIEAHMRELFLMKGISRV